VLLPKVSLIGRLRRVMNDMFFQETFFLLNNSLFFRVFNRFNIDGKIARQKKILRPMCPPKPEATNGMRSVLKKF
jgi:hypothetical protein